MKNRFLSIALLFALPILTSNSPASKDIAATDNYTTVCVDWALFGAGPNPGYFNNKRCAQTFHANYPGSTLIYNPGAYCVDSAEVIICP